MNGSETGLMNGPKRECQCPRAKHRHGTVLAYNADRCRCHQCTTVTARHRKVWRLRFDRRKAAGLPAGLVDAAGTRRRLRALSALGWSTTRLAAELGTSQQRVSELQHHIARVQAQLAVRVAALYDRAWNIVPTWPGSPRVRADARRKGWLPPLAFDDDRLDDPTYQPHTPEPETPALDEVLVERYMDGAAPPCGRYRKPPERLEAIRRLAAKGFNDSEIGRRIRLDRCAVGKERERHGIPAGQPRETAA